MNTSLYVTFVLAAALLILSPGPTVMFVTSTSLRSGRRAGLIAVAGSTVAAALQLSVVVGGLASVVVLAGAGFELIRWAGVAYLVYLGVNAWRSNAQPSAGPGPAPARRGIHSFTQGFIVTLTNPKTLLFHGAFLPQFVDPAFAALPQMVVLALSFVVIAGIGDSAWAVLAAEVGAVFRSPRARRVIDRMSGSILIGAGILLATLRRSEQ